MAEGYADSGHIFSVDFNRKVIVYWWLSAMFTLTVSFIGIPLLIIWLPFGWLVHRKQFEHLACALTNRSINIRMGWLFKKQQNIPLDMLTDVQIHEGPILNALGVVKMSFETAGSTPFYLTGVKDGPKFRDIILKQRDSLSLTQSAVVAIAAPESPSNDVLVEIRDILQQINTNLSGEDE